MNNVEKEYASLIKQIKNLGLVKPGDKFRKKIMTKMVPSLSVTNPSFLYLPAPSWKLAIAAILLVFLGGTGIVFAAEKSNPKDLLYPVKIMVENAQLSLTKNPSVKTLLHLDNADKRIEELKKTINKNGDGEIENITSNYESQVKGAVGEIKKVENQKEEVIKQTDQHLEDQTQKLEEIKKSAPTTAVPVIEKAIETSKNGQDELGNTPTDEKNKKINSPSSEE
ncbi:DUF5667 domain-containing protein [Patescibacteria group bacterium]|nr:DUF5667 domain-containing protein [Patescibacteria group bacterium]